MTGGRRALLRLLQLMPAYEVALRCRVHKSNVSRWASGAWMPSTRARMALEEHCGISAKKWAEREGVNRLPSRWCR